MFLSFQVDRKDETESGPDDCRLDFVTVRNIDARQLNVKYVIMLFLVLVISIFAALLFQPPDSGFQPSSPDHLSREIMLFTFAGKHGSFIFALYQDNIPVEYPSFHVHLLLTSALNSPNLDMHQPSALNSRTQTCINISKL